MSKSQVKRLSVQFSKATREELIEIIARQASKLEEAQNALSRLYARRNVGMLGDHVEAEYRRVFRGNP